MHQWVKNTLLFVPVLTAHKVLDLYMLATALLAFAAFCCCASSAYVLNHLLDLEADRHHRTKCKRPFACGALPVMHGLRIIVLLLLAAIGLCWFLPFEFFLVLAVYYLTTSAYSCWLKQLVVIDVIVLASLYTFRIIAGSAATDIVLSEWLLAFSMFIFLSLAMVKRYVELLDLRNMGFKEEAVGRGYHVRDIELLSSLGGASGYLSLLIFALYLNSDLVQSMYNRPYLLWLVCPLLLYWISRV